jgi:molecular chaperone DnaK (HSP70)
MNNQNYPNDYVVGIDLGTRFSCAGVWINKRFEVIPDQFGNRTIPSVVAFYKSVKLVGYNALAMKDINPANTIYDIKRIIGRRMTDPVLDLVRKIISYEVIDDQSDHHNILVQLDKADIDIRHKKTYRPEEICACILREIKKMTSDYLHKNVYKAVITVPAYFNDSQRQATLDAAKIAGLDVIKLINEPTAAALAYGLGNKKWEKKDGGNVIIYDFGAGTLDVSLMNINNGVFRTIAVGGNVHLGGEDIDYLIMNHVMLDFQKQNKIKDLKISKLAHIKLKNSAENAKKILSTNKKAVICVDDFYQNKRLYYVITRKILETICNELFIMCIKPLNDVLESAGMSKNDIDDIILIGGSTKIPKLQKLILDFFQNTNIKKLTVSTNPDEIVATGASIYGYIITHHEDPFSDNLVLLDITPLSLGVETLQKQMTVIIPRNTVIPTKKTKIFSTDTDYQDSVSIKIFEGERKLTKNNFHVGTFVLSGFEKGPRGYPIIKITFHIDINGILQVTAREKRSGVENSIRITSTWSAKGRLSKNEIEKIIEEAEKYEQIDTLCSLKIGLVHNISSICNAILINLNDDAYSLTDADKKRIKADVKNNLRWIKNKDLEELQIDELKKRERRLSSLYSPLIVQINKKNSLFKESNTNTNAAEIYGDDENNEDQIYEKIISLSGPIEYEKEKIRELKKTISDLCNNILSMVNNPISKMMPEDISLLSDYIGSVQIWIYTTNACTTNEFIAKINEINIFTEKIMEKYRNDKIFDNNDHFTAKDELYLTCLTLKSSLKSNFFSLRETDIDMLTKMIEETMDWLISHQYEKNHVYRDKLKMITELCNSIYHNMHRFTIQEQTSDISDKDEELDLENDSSDNSEEIISRNKIDEGIDLLVNQLPNELIGKTSDDILLKIDLNKLNKEITKCNHTK